VIETDQGADDIEILDLDAYGSDLGEEIVGTEPAGSLSPLAIVAGLSVAAIAMFGVINAGNTPAPAPPAPLVTVPPEPISAEEAALVAQVAELEATYGVEIGDGPGLRWQPVIWNIDADEFGWVDDGFVGDNGKTEWAIKPNTVGPTVLQVESLELEFPGYRMEPVDGARLLIPEEGSAEHLLVVVGDRDPVRFELSPPAATPSTGLVRSTSEWFDAVVIDDQLVIVGHQFLQIDFAVLGERVGRDLSEFGYVVIGPDQILPRRLPQTADDGPDLEPILFDEVDFSEAELADLGLLDADTGRPGAFSMSLSDGIVAPLPLEDLAWADSVSRTATGAAVVWTDSQESLTWLSTSADGITWSTKPISSAEGTVWFAGSRIFSFPTGGPSSIRRTNDLGRTWQQTRRPFVASLNNLAVDDVLIVVERAMDDNELPDVAVTRWDPNADDPEWLIQPVNKIFANALDVDFVVGDGHILAVAVTASGLDYYLASAKS